VSADQNTIDDEIDSIVASGVLGRSQVYPRLLRYLAAATTEQRVASEIDIATDVFSKGGVRTQPKATARSLLRR